MIQWKYFIALFLQEASTSSERKRLRTSIVDSVKYHKSYLGSEVPQQVINTVPTVKPVKNLCHIQGQHNDYIHVIFHTLS